MARERTAWSVDRWFAAAALFVAASWAMPRIVSFESVGKPLSTRNVTVRVARAAGRELVGVFEDGKVSDEEDGAFRKYSTEEDGIVAQASVQVRRRVYFSRVWCWGRDVPVRVVENVEAGMDFVFEASDAEQDRMLARVAEAWESRGVINVSTVNGLSRTRSGRRIVMTGTTVDESFGRGWVVMAASGALLLCGVVCAVVSGVALWAAARRPGPECCQGCGYSLVGVQGTVCPECGERR